MSLADIQALMPLIVIAAAPLLLMLVIAVRRHHGTTAFLTLAAFAAASIFVYQGQFLMTRNIKGLLIIDQYALFYMGLIFAAGFALALLSFGYLEGREGHPEEYYLLLLIASLGASILVASNHFVSLFLGLETLSVSLYTLIAYLRTKERSIEAGLKYLILAAASSAFLLFGMALVYAETGSMAFAELAARLSGTGIRQSVVLMGLAMMIVGVGFKLAVVPFHLWTPDVYEGAPAPVSALVATVSKGGMFAVLMRFFYQVNGYDYPSLLLIFAVIAVASMFAGNLLALLQNNVKRILAYSSIAHLGYLLVAFLSGGPLAVESVAYYLVAYFVTTLGAFGIVTILSDKEFEAEQVQDYRGLYWRRPGVAAIFTAMLLSLAGIPLTAGFIGKYYILAAGVDAARWALVIILVINSAIGLFYYLRVIIAMYSQPESLPEEASPERASSERIARASRTVKPLPLGGSVALGILTLLLIWLGIFPAALMEVVRSITASLS